MLFGGLVTVPFWEYRCLSKAYLDIMMSDLPRVDYKTGDKEKFDEEDQEKALSETKKLQENLKNGIFGSKGIKLDLNRQKSINSLVNKAR